MPTYPQKENWEIRAIVVPPKSMGGNLCVSCSKPKMMKLKEYLCLVQSPRGEAKRLTVFDCENLLSLKGNISSIHFK